MTLKEFLQAIPKMELHCHLYGAVRKETFAQLAKRHNAPLTAADIDEYYTRPRKPWPTNNVLRALDEHLIKEPDDLYQIGFEYLHDAAAHAVRYSEFFWNPTATAQAGITYDAAQDAIVRAIGDAHTQCGIVGRLIPAIDRERGPAAASEMVQWVIDNRKAEVLGIGIDFNEADHPPELFVDAYDKARRADLHVTAHAGENGVTWKNIETALDVLRAERIDHGYTIIENPDLVRRCADRGIVFTVIPTNSFYLRTLPDERWALDHPIRKMPGLGLRIHPNTDNPTLHNVTPTDAWAMMINDFAFNLDDIRAFMINGLDAAWIDEGQRSVWRREWTEEFDALRAQLGGQAEATTSDSACTLDSSPLGKRNPQSRVNKRQSADPW
jgi:adenosine deaminase